VTQGISQIGEVQNNICFFCWLGLTIIMLRSEQLSKTKKNQKECLLLLS
jgi:hypothetical protein